MSTKTSYVAEPLDGFGIIYKVGFYRPSGTWVDAPHVEGWTNHGGIFSGPKFGYTKDIALEYLNWLNGKQTIRSFSLND